MVGANMVMNPKGSGSESQITNVKQIRDERMNGRI